MEEKKKKAGSAKKDKEFSIWTPILIIGIVLLVIILGSVGDKDTIKEVYDTASSLDLDELAGGESEGRSLTGDMKHFLYLPVSIVGNVLEAAYAYSIAPILSLLTTQTAGNIFVPVLIGFFFVFSFMLLHAFYLIRWLSKILPKKLQKPLEIITIAVMYIVIFLSFPFFAEKFIAADKKVKADFELRQEENRQRDADTIVTKVGIPNIIKDFKSDPRHNLNKEWKARIGDLKEGFELIVPFNWGDEVPDLYHIPCPTVIFVDQTVNRILPKKLFYVDILTKEDKRKKITLMTKVTPTHDFKKFVEEHTSDDEVFTLNIKLDHVGRELLESHGCDTVTARKL